MMRRVAPRFAIAALVAAAVIGGGYAFDTFVEDADAAGVLGPGSVEVRIEIDNSRFEPERIVVRPMTDVRFVLVNRDPIHHELIVGPPEVHERHEHGTEPEHLPVPGEVSVGPGETVTTEYHFHEQATFDFACHLPGHVAYGMVGEVEVRAE